VSDLEWAHRGPDFAPDDLFDPEHADSLYVHNDGAYVLAASKRTSFVYPLGRSRVFYIGMARAESGRLEDHRRHARNARAELARTGGTFESRWWPRYTYAAKFGATVYWFTRRGRQSAGQLEADLFQRFHDEFGSIPVANGQWPGWRPNPAAGVWSSIIRTLGGG
jgi:hypothetical protein